jgi:hypothetical protein
MNNAEIEEDKNDDVKKKEVLNKARRTLGFEPIRKEDIDRQYKECGMFGIPQNDDDAKTMVIRELMLLDMKISKKEQLIKIIVRSFAPRREHASMLDQEFSNLSSVHKVYSHTRHMRRGTTISLYIPKRGTEPCRRYAIGGGRRRDPGPKSGWGRKAWRYGGRNQWRSSTPRGP